MQELNQELTGQNATDEIQRTLLIDGDIYLHQVCCYHNDTINWGENCITIATAPPRTLIEMIRYKFEKLKTELKADEIIVAFSSCLNWRKQVLSTYKENRKDRQIPVGLAGLKLNIGLHYKCVTKPRLEADDLLGMMATDPSILGEKIIVTIDKDLKQIPGKLYLTNKPELGVITITDEEADLYRHIQSLSGDSVDNYKGCKGIGEIKAREILQKAERKDWCKIIVKKYLSKGHTKEYALQNYMVSKLLQHGDYNKDTGQAYVSIPKEFK